MSLINKWFTLALIAALYIGICSGCGVYAADKQTISADYIKCSSYEEKTFMASIGAASASKAEAGGISGGIPGGIPRGISGGIIPHHLLASDMIAAFFKTLSEESPDVIVVIGPNHKRAGASKLYTSGLDWETPFGVLEADESITDFLINGKNAAESRDLMEEEYSVSALIPYIRYYMPQTKIVPILLSGNYSLKNSINLGEDLAAQFGDRKGIIVASVDFSHYLPLETAEEMDEITLRAITDNDLVQISKMGNDNLDSPPSIISLLAAMDMLGVKNLKILDHSNSDLIGKSFSKSTTSYFSIIYWK